jgi:hypothetical protein
MQTAWPGISRRLDKQEEKSAQKHYFKGLTLTRCFIREML